MQLIDKIKRNFQQTNMNIPNIQIEKQDKILTFCCIILV